MSQKISPNFVLGTQFVLTEGGRYGIVVKGPIAIMVTIEDIIEKKPHLKDALKLYERVIEFKKFVSNIEKNPISLRDIAYPSELVSTIFESFSLIFDIPEEKLVPLKEAMRLGQIDLTRLPLNETPAISLPYHKDKLPEILFLISKPYFIWLGDLCNLDNMFWEEGRCSVCNAIPSIASIDKESRRQLYCSFCETVGYYKRIGCPVCLHSDTSKMNIITAEGEEEFRINTCDVCGSYVKTVEVGLLTELTPELADLVSLPLDIVAQERGYRRLSPNPIGMIKIL